MTTTMAPTSAASIGCTGAMNWPRALQVSAIPSMFAATIRTMTLTPADRRR